MVGSAWFVFAAFVFVAYWSTGIILWHTCLNDVQRWRSSRHFLSATLSWPTKLDEFQRFYDGNRR